MRPEDKTEFAQTVTAMASHKRQTLTAMDHRFWWEGMQDWTLADFQAAAFQLVKTKEFMPSMKDFEDLRKAGRMTAGEAFAKAIHWARTGTYGNPAKTPEAIFIDRVVHAMGGWSRITGHDPEQLQWLEKSFAEHYADIQDATDTREALPQITGSLHPRLEDGLKRLQSV
ncbi:MAG: DUF6475 domain-containing protein [Terriglobia bacterium]|nr:DUF6475 domain-containing protein [Terriglobia bacterium]